MAEVPSSFPFSFYLFPWRGLFAFVLVTFLPGAVLFRAPVFSREQRARLAFEERAFWAVVTSLAWSLSVTLALAVVGQYNFGRLLLINVATVGVSAAAWRRRLAYGGSAAPPGWYALLPLVLIGLGVRFFFPSSEYIIGGKDPGTYMNEGIQIAQRGSLVIHDPVIASVPPTSRDLFFPPHGNPSYYGIRFMGFFILEPDEGRVVGQFPHLYPASIAIAYGLDGVTGARRASGFWAVLGLLAVYFAGARLIGPLPAAAASSLLGMHEVQIWFARYPNAELAMQALLFAALLATARAHIDQDRFFQILGGTLLALLLFVRFEAALAIAVVLATFVLGKLEGRPIPWMLVSVVAAATVLAGWYYAGMMAAYIATPVVFVSNVGVPQLIAAPLASVGLLALVVWASRHEARAERVRSWMPGALVVIVLAAAIYAYFFRTAGGRTAIHDATALRTFTSFYLLVPGLVAALLGYALLVKRVFWRDPAFILTVTAFALFFFYKIRIVPEHFWMARRFLPAVLPAALLFAAGAALVGLGTRRRALQAVRVGIGVVFLVLLGNQYLHAAQPVIHHVEYAGIIPKLEQIASTFGADDLVLVESRNASDTHVLAVPLAYIYARQVLVLNTPVPDKSRFRDFLAWARSRYRRVFFIGSGGTDLLSRAIAVSSVASDRFQVPEYESPLNAYPRRVTYKEFDYGIYQFVDPRPESSWFTLDVGVRDDLHVVRFHAKEATQGRTFRWTRDASYVSVLNPQPDSRVVTLWMHNGGRPATVVPASVTITLNGRVLGSTVVQSGFQPYSFTIPRDLAEAAARDENPAQLKIESTLWNPQSSLGVADDRQLGVMLDRIEVR